MPPVPAPPSVDRIVGHSRALGVLRAALTAGRLHHAWIFAGPPGVGKFTTALWFAAELLTPVGAPGAQARELLAGGRHPDLHVIRKELAAVSRKDSVRRGKQFNIPIEVVREFLVEPAERTRVIPGDSAGAKVFIVDEAELLDRAGQDAMLKTLEEPPAGTVMILVAAAEEELSATIRSRCQRVAFTPLTETEFSAWLRAARLPDVAGLNREDEALLRRFAAGSPGVAELAVRTGIAAWWRTIGPALAGADAGRFSPGLGQTMADVADAWARQRVGDNERASKDAANRAAARWMFRMIAEHYRARLADPASRAAALRALDFIRDAERQADNSVQLAFVMECLLAQLATGPEPVTSGGASTPRR